MIGPTSSAGPPAPALLAPSASDTTPQPHGHPSTTVVQVFIHSTPLISTPDEVALLHEFADIKQLPYSLRKVASGWCRWGPGMYDHLDVPKGLPQA